MQPTPARHPQPTQRPAPPAPRKLTVTKETLRRLSPADLRLAAGGFRSCGCKG